MPAGFAAIGGAAIFGGMTGAAAIVTGIAVSAVVGAAIGGLTAAVMGGDIGKGMLFGAVGGVVTGGLAGGSIMGGLGIETTGLATSGAGIGGMPTYGGSTLIDVAGGATVDLTAKTAGTVATAATKPGLFGGALGKMFEGTGGQIVGALGQGFMGKDQPVDWRTTKEGVMYTQEQLNKRQKIATSRSGGGGGGSSSPPYLELERLKQKGALNQIAAQSAEDRKAIQLKGQEGRTTQKQEYKLANENAQKEWDRGMDKLRDASGAAASGEYQSGQGAYEAVLAAQQGRGYEQGYERPGDAALAGPQAVSRSDAIAGKITDPEFN